MQPGNKAERRALTRFADQLTEELNVKKVTLHEPSAGPLLRVEVKPNMKPLGPKFGPRLKDVVAAIAAAPATDLAARVQRGQPFDLDVGGGRGGHAWSACWIGGAMEGAGGRVRLLADGETQVLLDGRITPDLAREGMFRDVVRQVQELRKKADLEMEDRIELYLASPDAELTAAIATYTSTIAAETLTVRWAPHDLDGEAARAEVKVDGKPLDEGALRSRAGNPVPGG